MSETTAPAAPRRPPRSQYEINTHGMHVLERDTMDHIQLSPAEFVPASVRLIDVTKAAKLYGGVSTKTITRWADTGVIPPGIRVGGRRFFDARELLDHINRGCPKVS